MLASWMLGSSPPAPAAGRRQYTHKASESPASGGRASARPVLMAAGRKKKEEGCLVGVKIEPAVVGDGWGKRKVPGRSGGDGALSSPRPAADRVFGAGHTHRRSGYTSAASPDVSLDMAGRRMVDGRGGGVPDVASPFSPRPDADAPHGRRQYDTAFVPTNERTLNPPRAGREDMVPKSRRLKTDGKDSLRGGVPVHKPLPKAETANLPHQVDTHRRHYTPRSNGAFRSEPERAVRECTKQLDHLRATTRHARATPHTHRRTQEAPEGPKAFGQRKIKGDYYPPAPAAPGIMWAGLHAEPPAAYRTPTIKIGSPASQVWQP